MVYGAILQGAIRVGTIVAQGLYRTTSADIKMLRHVGWKPGAARGISHGIFAAGGAEYLKGSSSNTGDGTISPSPSSETYQQDKARGRFQRYSSKKRSSNKQSYHCSRCARSRKSKSSYYR